jgi:hypothetical protein
MKSSVPPGTPPVPMYRYGINEKGVLFCMNKILQLHEWKTGKGCDLKNII